MPEPADDWEPEQFTSAVCRPVTLASGETIPVLGGEPMSAEGVAALGELVDVVRAKMAAENPPDEGAPALWWRIKIARGRRSLRQVAGESGVRFAVLFRIGQGRMPDADDLARIEAWLETSTRGAGSASEPAPDAGGSDGRA